MFTGPVGPVEVFFYWPEAVFGNFYWPGAIGSPLASSPVKISFYSIWYKPSSYIYKYYTSFYNMMLRIKALSLPVVPMLAKPPCSTWLFPTNVCSSRYQFAPGLDSQPHCFLLDDEDILSGHSWTCHAIYGKQ